MGSIFDDFVLDLISNKEKGYSNRSNDAGGKTRWGITEAVARQFGYKGEMEKLPQSLAKQIYKELYWDSLRLTDIADLSPAIALKLADIGVNMGTSRAGEYFQTILNVMNNQQKLYPDLKTDGKIGTKTIATFKTYLSIRGHDGETVFVRALNCLQGAKYVSLALARQTDEDNIYGWFLKRIY